MAKLVYLEDVERIENTVLTVGTFDGVHAGHRVLVNKVISEAKERKARSVIVTFDPHPREIINPGSSGINLLTTLKERCGLLAEMGIDEMVVIPFDRDFSLLSSHEFVRDIIWKKIGVSRFIIGYDHQFGKDREGSIGTVKKLGEELGFDAYIVSKHEVGDKAVSSTKIRNALEEKGDVEEAAILLERYYLLSGTVVHGNKQGNKIGFPTANLLPSHPRKIVPKNGVYAVWVEYQNNYYRAMMNIGTRPTYKGTNRTIEIHILDFDRDIYGESLKIQFVKRIRNEVKFDSVDELKNRLSEDRAITESVLKENKPDIAILKE